MESLICFYGVQGLWQSVFKTVRVTMGDFWAAFPDFLDTDEEEKETLNVLFADGPNFQDNR